MLSLVTPAEPLPELEVIWTGSHHNRDADLLSPVQFSERTLGPDGQPVPILNRGKVAYRKGPPQLSKGRIGPWYPKGYTKQVLDAMPTELWVTIRILQMATGLPNNTVGRSCRRLRKYGQIEFIAPPNGRGRPPALYKRRQP